MPALSLARCCARVAAGSFPPVLFADSGERKELPTALPEKFRAVGDAGRLDFKPGDFKFMLASLASIWLCMDPRTLISQDSSKTKDSLPPTAGESNAVMGSDLAIC